MRITFILPYAGLAGGVRVVAVYAEHLRRRGHDVAVISKRPSIPVFKAALKYLLWREGVFAEAKLGNSHLEGCQVSHTVIDRASPLQDCDVLDGDIVVATWWETAEWVARLSEAKGVKTYLIQHDEAQFVGQPRNRVEATWFLPMHKITVAQWLVDLARSRCGDTNVSLVPNSVDRQQFHAPHRAKQSPPTVGTMYATSRLKGCDIAFEAVKRALTRIQDLMFVAFGARVPSRRLRLPRGTGYVRCPSQQSIRKIYAQCDAWLFPSRSEGFGLPILEAMACRTPVIGTPAGAAPELLSKGGGVLVKPDDPEDMARAIVHVCGLRNSEWQQLSDAAYRTASSYTWEDATDLFEDALLTAIRRSAAGEIEGGVHATRLR